MSSLWILGGGSIAQALAQHAQAQGQSVHLLSTRLAAHTNPHANLHTDPYPSSCSAPGLHWHQIEDWHEPQWLALLDNLPLPEQIVVTNGLLSNDQIQPEKRLEELNLQSWRLSLQANTEISLQLLAFLAGRMKRQDALQCLILSAKVGSIQDNRLGGWYAYRASKAALNMLIKTASIEWQRRFPLCSLGAYHPGTTDSALSRPFQSRVPDQQLKTPEQAALCLAQQLNQLTPENSGRFWNWDGQELPW